MLSPGAKESYVIPPNPFEMRELRRLGGASDSHKGEVFAGYKHMPFCYLSALRTNK